MPKCCVRLRREVDKRIEPHPFLTSDFTENNPIAREIMETGIRILFRTLSSEAIHT